MFPVSQLTVRLAAAACAFTAQLAHLWVLPEEFTSWPVRGMFFFVVAMIQGILAVLIAFGPRRSTVWFGIAFNALVVGIWLFSRTIGVPSLIIFIPEPFAWPDAIATAAELLLITLLVCLRTLPGFIGQARPRLEERHA